MFALLENDDFFADKLDLLHARFRFCDREEREQRVLERFGKPDENGENPKRPKCAVLIATQIIEQSLDIDFDLMISDLAPIDLLLQRIGRLFRHERIRSETFDVPNLWIIEPETDENGLPDFKNSIVYDKHILFRTWLILKELEQIKIPKDVEFLIEQVYDFDKTFENLNDKFTEFWQKTLAECLDEIVENEKQAEYRYIKYPHYSRHLSGIFGNNLEEDSPKIHQTLQAVTRLTEPTATVICLWEKDGKTYLDETFTREIDLNKQTYLEQTKELLRYSVSVSKKSVVFELFKDEVPTGWKESALLRHHRVLKFDENGICRKFKHIFKLDKKLGLQITKEDTNV